MEDKLLSRDAIDRNLRRIGRERAPGKKLVGVRFDSGSKTWFVVLKNEMRAISTQMEQVSSPAAPRRAKTAAHRNRTVRAKE
jgi:hypothetical protein